MDDEGRIGVILPDPGEDGADLADGGDAIEVDGLNGREGVLVDVGKIGGGEGDLSGGSPELCSSKEYRLLIARERTREVLENVLGLLKGSRVDARGGEDSELAETVWEVEAEARQQLTLVTHLLAASGGEEGARRVKEKERQRVVDLNKAGQELLLRIFHRGGGELNGEEARMFFGCGLDRDAFVFDSIDLDRFPNWANSKNQMKSVVFTVPNFGEVRLFAWRLSEGGSIQTFMVAKKVRQEGGNIQDS